MHASPRGSENLPVATGYRLQKLELCNWGTFDRDVFSARPCGLTTLLVGQNGSGKSTLVDALLTLLVRPGVRNFNVAAGAKKTERDERSYLKGAYDRSSDDDGQGIRVKFLRPNPNGYSAILASFQNLDNAKAFTLAQLLYLNSEQSVEKVYCFADSDRSITEAFSGLGAPDSLLKALRQTGWRATRTFSEYEGWFLRAVRAKAKAMEVLNQTVAVKDIQRLNDFIRHHMLEPQPWDEKVDRLLGHFVQLSEAHQSLVRVRQQSDHLQPIAQHGASYREHVKELERAEHLKAAVDSFFAQRTIDVFSPEIELRRQTLNDTRDKLAGIERALGRLDEQRRRLQNEIDEAGGQRLRDIPLLLETERAHVQLKEKERVRYVAALRQAGLTDVVEDEHAFDRVRRHVPALRDELRGEIRRKEDERIELGVARRDARELLGEHTRELESLAQRRENLPGWCIALRQNLADDLRVPAKDLPFAAELIAVHPDAKDWESSIEKVLRNFALSLLVPERLYHVVGRYVDRTKLMAHGRGQRLVYLRVGEQVQPGDSPAPGQNSLVRKLVLRKGHALVPWVEAELNRRFDYTCCNTIEEFQQIRGQAMTRFRHIKSTNLRHEKDDRDQVLDPQNFVLGWDNHEKRRRIASEVNRLRQRESELEEQIEGIGSELTRCQERLSALDTVFSFARYDEVDFARHTVAIASLEEERKAIEEQSDTIQVLKARVADLDTEGEALRVGRNESIRREALLEKEIDDGCRLIANAEAALKRRESDGVLTRDREYFNDLARTLGHEPLTVSDLLLQERQNAVYREQQAAIDRLRAALHPVEQDLLKSMNRFLREFPDLRKDLDAGTEYLDSFLGLRQRILDEDLPKHERRFKERLNEKVIQEIGLFRGELEHERRTIQEKIETLNVSLRRLEYRPGTHIQLEPRAVRDPEIVEFQTRLRECIEGSFEDSPEGNEARFIRIQELLHRLQDEGNRRWREKVTDVRRWFDFVAAVIDRETQRTVSSYEDSSGQSGGEKAKLAFTILVAAIAYQYDLDPEYPARDRFQFVVVDEMFSKVDDQHAEYALELFRHFGLQLLIVAPLDAKARVTQPYVGCYLHVNKRENRSEIFEMTAQEFEELVDGSRPGDSKLPTSAPSVSM